MKLKNWTKILLGVLILGLWSGPQISGPAVSISEVRPSFSRQTSRNPSYSFSPYIFKITMAPAQAAQVKSLIKALDQKSNLSLLSSKGNFPISIRYEKFRKDLECSSSERDFGYAEISSAECEIVLNKDKKWNEKLLALILYHEIAHCLGHDHPSRVDGKIVYGKIMSEELDEDDLNGEIADLPQFYKDLSSITPPAQFSPKREVSVSAIERLINLDTSLVLSKEYPGLNSSK